MVDGPKLSDGSPAPAETALTLIGEGQTLVDLIKRPDEGFHSLT